MTTIFCTYCMGAASPPPGHELTPVHGKLCGFPSNDEKSKAIKLGSPGDSAGDTWLWPGFESKPQITKTFVVPSLRKPVAFGLAFALGSGMLSVHRRAPAVLNFRVCVTAWAGMKASEQATSMVSLIVCNSFIAFPLGSSRFIPGMGRLTLKCLLHATCCFQPYIALC